MLNKKIRMLAGVGAAMAIISLSGCDTTSSKGERSEGRALDDENITADVKKSLDAEPAYKLNGVEIKTFAGIVELSGFVDTQGQKARAQEIAERTGGVREVVNGITLKPVMPTATSRANEGSQIYAEPQNPTMPASTNDGNQSAEPK